MRHQVIQYVLTMKQRNAMCRTNPYYRVTFSSKMGIPSYLSVVILAYNRLQEGNHYQYVMVISLIAQAQHTRFLQDGLIFGRHLHINLWMGMREMITYTVENLRSSRSCQPDGEKKSASFIQVDSTFFITIISHLYYSYQSQDRAKDEQQPIALTMMKGFSHSSGVFAFVLEPHLHLFLRSCFW